MAAGGTWTRCPVAPGKREDSPISALPDAHDVYTLLWLRPSGQENQMEQSFALLSPRSKSVMAEAAPGFLGCVFFHPTHHKISH